MADNTEPNRGKEEADKGNERGRKEGREN